jgi:hypothetical protein
MNGMGDVFFSMLDVTCFIASGYLTAKAKMGSGLQLTSLITTAVIGLFTGVAVLLTIRGH